MEPFGYENPGSWPNSVPTGYDNISTPESTPQVNSTQLRMVMLSTEYAVKKFFQDNSLPYYDVFSPSKNLLDNIHRLPVDNNCIYIIEDLLFRVGKGDEYSFPANYRAKNVKVVGEGDLLFTWQTLELDHVGDIGSWEELNDILEVYYPNRSVIWNILQAEKNGNWPYHAQITLCKMCLDIEEDLEPFFEKRAPNDHEALTIDLPNNITTVDCYVNDTHGNVLSCSKGRMLVTGADAIAKAVGPNATLLISDGQGYVALDAKGIAVEKGRVFGLDSGSRIWAYGTKAKAIGMKDYVDMYISGGALGVKHTENVNAIVDDDGTENTKNTVRLSVVHDKPLNNWGYIKELNDLVMLGDPAAALKLGLVKTDHRRACFGDTKNYDFYFKMAREKGTGEIKRQACRQLARYYCSQYTFQKVGECHIDEKYKYELQGYEIQIRPDENDDFVDFCEPPLFGQKLHYRYFARQYYDEFLELSGKKPTDEEFHNFELNNVKVMQPRLSGNWRPKVFSS